MSNIPTSTRQKLTPFRVVDYCPKCVEKDDVALKDCALKSIGILACNPPKHRVACPLCDYVGSQAEAPNRIEYEIGPFIR